MGSAETMALYSVSDVVRSYDWLDHHPGVTEVCILHPEYRQGDAVWNRSHAAWPRTHYITTTSELLGLVRQYAGERMVCYGINPRPTILRHADGRCRAAKEPDIAHSQSVVVDIDLEGEPSPSRLASLTRFLRVADDYWIGLGLRRPVRAASGNRGSHLLFAYEPIMVAACPDIRERLRSFRAQFVRALQQDLSRLEARVDTGTLNLRAMAKVYGTCKPGGINSRFYSNQRTNDPVLRDYLLQLPTQTMKTAETISAIAGDTLPEWFTTLLRTDTVARDLWHGKGKHAGDQSTSAYDYAIVRHLAAHGITDTNALATIIALRPNSTARTKGPAYLARTIANAIARNDSDKQR